MHSVLSDENQPFATQGPTIFVAEVASTLNEALLLDHLYAKTDDSKERIALFPAGSLQDESDAQSHVLDAGDGKDEAARIWLVH